MTKSIIIVITVLITYLITYNYTYIDIESKWQERALKENWVTQDGQTQIKISGNSLISGGQYSNIYIIKFLTIEGSWKEIIVINSKLNNRPENWEVKLQGQ